MMGRHCLVAAVVAVAACYSPTIPLGVTCVPDGVCPTGQMCSGGTCVELNSSLPDAARGDAAFQDAPLADAGHVVDGPNFMDAAFPDGAWELVQVNGTSNGNGQASLPVTIDATGEGHLVVVAIEYQTNGTIQGVTDDGSDGTSSYVAVPSSLAGNNSGGGALEIWFASTSHAGATTVTPTANNDVYAVVVWEFATKQPATVDVADALANQEANTRPVSPTITTADAGELVVAAVIPVGSASVIATGNEFTNDIQNYGDGWAHITSHTAPAGAHQAVWDSSDSKYASDAVAFHVGE